MRWEQPNGRRGQGGAVILCWMPPASLARGLGCYRFRFAPTGEAGRLRAFRIPGTLALRALMRADSFLTRTRRGLRCTPLNPTPSNMPAQAPLFFAPAACPYRCNGVFCRGLSKGGQTLPRRRAARAGPQTPAAGPGRGQHSVPCAGKRQIGTRANRRAGPRDFPLVLRPNSSAFPSHCFSGKKPQLYYTYIQ